MNILDSRDLAKRLAELTDLRDSLEGLLVERLEIKLQVPTTARETKARHAELMVTQSQIDAAIDEFGEDEIAELAELESLESEVSEWKDGATLIDESDFVEYAQEMLEDCGDLPKDLPSYIVINWDATAENLKADYTTVTYLGTDYLVRV